MADEDWREELQPREPSASADVVNKGSRGNGSTSSLQERMRASARPFLLGLILVAVGTGGFYTYEKRAALGYQTLDNALRTVTHLTQVDTIDPTAEGKLVHATGNATTEEDVKDDAFGVHAKVLKLVRVVEVFQWDELKGETEGTVTYIKRFASAPIDSSKFKEPPGHDNPRLFPYEARAISAKAARMGALPCPPTLIAKLSRFEHLAAAQEMIDGAPLDVKSKAKIFEGAVVLAAKPEAPEIGDVRVSFLVVKPEVVSVVAKQEAAKFTPYLPNTVAAQAQGAESAVFEAVDGESDAKGMLHVPGDPKSAWYTRLALLLAALVGGLFFIKPFRPFEKRFREGTSRAALAKGAAGLMTGIALATIAAALPWLEYRPLIGGGIVGVGVLLLGLVATPVLRGSRKVSTK